MKPEHYKEFNLEHAKAGAPYAQRNGLAARIGIWDRHHDDYKLVGVYTSSNGTEIATSWSDTGDYLAAETGNANDLVMLPLGYCESRPVFVGDEIMTSIGGKFIVDSNTPDRSFTRCTWPRKEPVIPTLFLATRSMTNLGFISTAILYQSEIAAYQKALDEYNEVRK